MNPFIYLALLVLCVCSVLTRRVTAGGDHSSGWIGTSVASSVSSIAACMLASIGLASRTGAGKAFAGLVLVAFAIACVWCVWRGVLRKVVRLRRK